VAELNAFFAQVLLSVSMDASAVTLAVLIVLKIVRFVEQLLKR